MSLYVVPENQELLWNVINKNMYIQQYFATMTPDKQHEWFRTTIRMFYDKHRGKNITVSELDQINRDTIAHMIQDIRNSYVNSTPSTQPVSMIQSPPIHVDNRQSSYEQPVYPPPPNNQPSGIESMPYRSESKQNSYNQQFQTRQKEYQQMVEKKTPETPNFSDKVEDSPISNMDDLIQKHMSERANDLKQYDPPRSSNALHIDASSNVNVHDDAVELPPLENSMDRNVSWNNHVEYFGDSKQPFEEQFNSLQAELDDLRGQLLEQNANTNVQNEIANLKADVLKSNSELDDLREQLGKQNANVQTEIANLKAEVLKSNGELDDLRTQFIDIQIELSAIKKEHMVEKDPTNKVNIMKQEMQRPE